MNMADAVMLSYQSGSNASCDSVSGAFKEECDAGKAMRNIVDCHYWDKLAQESYFSICTTMTTGLVTIATALIVFFVSYLVASFVLALGYKRWNPDYLEY